MTTKTFKGVVTDEQGQKSEATIQFIVDDKPIIDSIIASPPNGPTGTVFMFTINGRDPEGKPLTFEGFVDNVAVSAVAGSPNVFRYQS